VYTGNASFKLFLATPDMVFDKVFSYSLVLTALTQPNHQHLISGFPSPHFL